MSGAFRWREIGLGTVLAGALLLPRPASGLNPEVDVSQYAHTSWKIRDGFVRGTIVAIAQTPDGYIWLGTEFGLRRFDGVRHVLWQPPAGQVLPSSYIRSLLAARDGTLWIGTAKGLVSWKSGNLTHYHETRSLERRRAIGPGREGWQRLACHAERPEPVAERPADRLPQSPRERPER